MPKRTREEIESPPPLPDATVEETEEMEDLESLSEVTPSPLKASSGGARKEKNEKKIFYWMAAGAPGLAVGYILYGFVEVLLVPRVPKDVKEDAKVEIELGKNCEMRTQGNELCVVVEDSGSVLVQMRKGSRNGERKQLTETTISSDKTPNFHYIGDAGRSDTELTPRKGSPLTPGVICIKEAESNKQCSGDGDGGQWTKRRSRCLSGLKNYYIGTLDQLHDMEKKNGMVVTGKVVHRHCSDSKEYFVVLFDVYLSEKFCTPGPRPFWKGGPSMAAGLSHLSNDYERRKRALDLELSYSPEEISKIGTCHVVGCKMHTELSETEKIARFDLTSIFTSLPKSFRLEPQLTTSLAPEEQVGARQTGLLHLPNEVLSSILSRLVPMDLCSVTAVCRHFRALSTSIMPCMNLKLYPHQEAAVRWMVQRERAPQTLPCSHSGRLVTEDGREVYFDTVTGDLLPEAPPGVDDFRGGMVCDEPGLGKTVTALSLILKTQGTLATPPPGVVIHWCEHSSHKRTGYYEVSTTSVPHGSMSTLKRCSLLKARRYQFDTTIKLSSSSWSHTLSSSSSSSTPSAQSVASQKQAVATWRSPRRGGQVLFSPCASTSASPIVASRPFATSESVRASGSVKRKLWNTTPERTSKKPRRRGSSTGGQKGSVQSTEDVDLGDDEDDTWAQCDACGKWRKIPPEGRPLKEELAWFCSMNRDELHQDCTVPEEIFDKNEMITSLPGFVHPSKVTDPEVNVPFFKTVLRSHAHHIDEEAKRALKWLVDLSRDKVLKAAVDGLQLPPTLQMATVGGHDLHHYDKILEAFGLTKKKEAKKSARWFYPKNLAGLVFDTPALRAALAEPVDEVMRFYLSKATLVVVPNNLVEHWRTQILKHISKGQLRYFIWNDVKRLPAAHVLAWEYDVVITTFTRLSTEWNSRETSALARIHWLRIVLDEGHTLGAGLSVTNKLQMAVSMRACRRWILTGTPTPNTPSTQVSYLQPMLKFLHEETYGNHSKVFDTAILRPFEAGTEEGRQLLVDLLQRCMISARKCDLHTIPACIRKAKLLDFTTEQHAASYNELVVTVRRNILMADWRDPSHVESLLNPKQWKFRNSTLRNVRLSCCVAGHIKVFNAKGDLHETMDILAAQGMSEESDEYQNIKTSLLIGGSCERCSEYCRLPIITPCRHLLCLACVSLDGTKCTLCGHPYQMQSPEDRARPENPNPKWPVPQDLIELQPSYVQEEWDPDWHHVSSSKIMYLIQQLKEINARNEKIFSQHVDIMDDKGKTQCLNAAPEKVIVFSQFLEHINLIEKQFVNAGINHVGMYSPMQIKDKMKSLRTFKCEPECTVLVMDGSVALGLDLSFVTHVYLMEPIWDRSMEEQVVSRAHRMGAVRPVLVETLAMRGTIEEQMLGLLKGSSGRRKTAQDPAETFLEELDFVKWKKN